MRIRINTGESHLLSLFLGASCGQMKECLFPVLHGFRIVLIPKIKPPKHHKILSSLFKKLLCNVPRVVEKCNNVCFGVHFNIGQIGIVQCHQTVFCQI